MSNKEPISVSFTLPDGKELTIETGKLATQADGSVVLRVGDMMLFASVVSSDTAREGQSFFPLSVDYQEQFSSAGRIPGNFFRREARLNDHEILVCRLVDRAIRPLFPDKYMNDTQVIINLISSDKENLPDAYAALATSTALTISDIPFNGPISEARVARIDGEFRINPSYEELQKADIELIVAANKEDVMMVEGEANECEEKELIEAIRTAHEAIKVQCEAQEKLLEKLGDKVKEKREVEEPEENEEIQKFVNNASQKIREVAEGNREKSERRMRLKEIQEELMESYEDQYGEEKLEEDESMIISYYDKAKKEIIREFVMEKNIRLDGRKPDEIRPIWTEVDYLPGTHGSAIFTRGETQSLTTVTLGTKLDEKMVDVAREQSYENFILHYNFPPYSVGEVRPQRGPGRREVGHGHLASRSLKKVMPEELPYTIRVVSTILESNGSSSMATVCAGSMGLMDAGIQLTAPIAGIAMGMIADEDRQVILSDILGDEDALGDMDFKIAGTEKGICGCQMDIKVHGLSYDVLEKALIQARDGRRHILNEMAKTISEAREDLKPHAPRMVKMVIDKEYIGAVIGPGGKVIQDLQERTGTTINIEEKDNKGIIHISSSDSSGIKQAVAEVEDITFEPQEGDVYDAEVEKLMPYGAFVKFRGKSGLLHISEVSYSHIDDITDVFSEGDQVKVKYIGNDPRSGKIRLSRKALMPKPEKLVENARSGGNKGDRNRGGGHRDGGKNRRNDGNGSRH